MNETLFSFHDVILIFTIIECLFFVAFRILLFNSRQLSNVILNLFFFSIAIASVGILLLYSNKMKIPFGASHGLAYFVMVCHGIRAPLLYFYVQSLIQPHFRFNWLHTLHLLPSIITIAAIYIYSITLNHLRFDPAFSELTAVIQGLWGFLKYVTLGYGSATIALVWLNHSLLVQSQSNFSFTKTVWLRLLVGGFFINWSWSLVIQFTGRFIGGAVADAVGIVHNYMIFILINALIAYSLYHFFQPPQRQIDIEETQQDKDDINPDDIKKVSTTVGKSSVFLDPNITLEKFSSRADLPVRTVSNIINKHYGKNFFDFINSHRIETAKALLTDPRKSNLTILEVLTRSGFNSTSSFHRYFKQKVGVTPTEFKESHSIDSSID